MGQISLTPRMSIPELMGDPCAGNLREHAEAILVATASSARLTRLHPDVAADLEELQEHVQRLTSSVLVRLADEAGLPTEGESVSPVKTRVGDYRIDREGQCWIWMRAVTREGYPVAGRKTKGRENVPSKIYWMLVHGPLEPDEIVVRTCGMRLCVNPEHGRVVNRREHAAERMRERSTLDWDAVREIRLTMCSSHQEIRRHAAELASRFGINEHSVMGVFRNKVWVDPDYVAGCDVRCAGPGCHVVFKTTSAIRKYHSEQCRDAAIAARSGGTPSREVRMERSAESREREQRTRRAEAEEWSEAVPEDPRASVWSVASLDQPIGDDGGVLRDVVASAPGDGDPVAALQHEAEVKLLAGVTEDGIQEMNDGDLARLQKRLRRAGLTPSVSRSGSS